eukprot:GEMP01085145.1.p1 GENE.GEMP01085145.1~~GEMP01085145.1.p1  ORF type:complete len:178 (+),score=22.31 GEMP01085145.1:69-602(+)
MLRIAGRLSPKFVRNATSIVASQETYTQKTLRWIDILGSLTKWHSRRAWLLDLDPCERSAIILMTEYERKLLMWCTWANYAMFPMCMWFWYGQFTHLASKPPCPAIIDSEKTNNRAQDFFWHGRLSPLWNASQGGPRCGECRFLEFECKKECYDRLKEKGINVYGLTRPRTQTWGFH